jgi:hypothetical protein
MSKYIKTLVPVAIVALCGCISQRAILYQPGDYTLATVKTLADREWLRLWRDTTLSERFSVAGTKFPLGNGFFDRLVRSEEYD